MRVYNKSIIDLQPGEYCKLPNGKFVCRTPDPKLSAGTLSEHEVIEHEDGTITVSPSILVQQPPIGSWHGYLERGIWREC